MGTYEKEIAFCSEKVCPDLSSLHYALLFQPPKDKAFWLGCFTLHHEIKRATLQQVEAGLTQVKLGWWRNALAQSREQKTQHPVLLAIGQDVVNAVNDEDWIALINRGVDACEPQRYDNMAMWTEHLESLLAPWEKVVAAWNGSSPPDGLKRFWAHATQLTQLLRLAKYIDQNFQPIPVQSLAKHGVTAESLRNRVHGEETSGLFTDAAELVIRSAEEEWQKLPQDHRLAVRPLRALYRMRLAEYRLHKKDGLNLLTEQKVLSPGRKFWTSWTSHVLRR